MNRSSRSDALRELVKTGLAHTARGPRLGPPARGASVLIYHRVGGGTRDELDLPVDRFEAQLDVLAEHDVVPLDGALDALDRRDDSHRVVLTFDDGFEDVYHHAWPRLRERGLPFTIYLAAAYVGRTLHWEGADSSPGARGLRWDQLRQMVDSGLCTVGNHTYTHVPPASLTGTELDRCTEAIDEALGVVPRHFAYPWGQEAPQAIGEVRRRFRSAALGDPGRNLPGDDPYRLRRIPVRRTDPASFFAAKLHGSLGPERRYARIVAAAKWAGAGR